MTGHRSTDSVLAILDCWPGGCSGVMSCGQLAEEAEAALAGELREVPCFQLRTTPSFQLDQSIFLSSPNPQSGSHIQNKFPPTPASWGPVLHPAADLLLFPVLFALWRAGCQAQQKSRAGPGPEMQEGWEKDGRERIAFSFLSICLQASILTTPLSPGPWSSQHLKSPVSTIELP